MCLEFVYFSVSTVNILQSWFRRDGNYYYHLSVLHQRKLMVFYWRLRDRKSPQVSMTPLSILAVFNNAVVWMVSTLPPISKSSRPFKNPLVTVPKAPISIGIIVTFKVEVLISLFTFFQFYSVVSRDSKVDNFADFIIFIIIIIFYSLRVFLISVS